MTPGVVLEGFDLEPSGASTADRTEPRKKPGKIHTFYSFKGGVGRSMALANIAVLVAAQSKKVLMVDFDLEAPGLEHFFLRHDPGLADRLATAPGVIDMLGASMADWRSARIPVDVDLDALAFTGERASDPGWRHLDIIHSGRASRPRKDYTDQVQRLNWTELYETHDIGTRFGRLRAEWIAEYDYVFIDSRTGVTDIGDLCTVVLPDHLVLLFVTNEQNIEGVASIYQRAVTEHRRLPFERSKLTVLPVLSRDEFYSENKLSREWRGRAADALSELFADWLPEDLRPIDAFQKIFIPYFAIWSFGEALPVLDEPDAASNPSSINAAYARIARLILHDLDWACLDEIADPAEVASTRISQRREIEEERRRLEEDIARQREEVRRTKSAGRISGWVTNLTVILVLTAAGYFGWNYFASEGLETEFARLEEQNAILRDEAARRAAELEQTRARLEAEASLATGYDTELEKTRVELDNARTEVEQLQARLSTLEGQNRSLSDARGEAGALREQLDDVRAELRRATEQHLESVKNNEQCRLALQQSEARFDDYMMRVKSELDRAASSQACQTDVQYLLRLLDR